MYNFVGNRIAEIQRLTDKNDRSHVKSENNPADVISRDMLPEQLLEYVVVGGPAMVEGETCSRSRSQPLIELPEVRTQVLIFHQIQNSHDLFSRYSSWNKLQRVVAYC